MLNKATIIGHLGADPEIRRTQDGKQIANFNVATSERWNDKNTGEKKEHTDWHRIVVFNENLAKVCEQYLKKGSKVYIEGAMKTRKWADDKGIDRYTTEVVLSGFNSTLTMLDGQSVGGGVPKAGSEDDYGQTRTVDRQSAPASQERKDSYGNQPANFSRDLDDDIPFQMEWR